MLAPEAAAAGLLLGRGPLRPRLLPGPWLPVSLAFFVRLVLAGSASAASAADSCLRFLPATDLTAACGSCSASCTAAEEARVLRRGFGLAWSSEIVIAGLDG